MKLFRFVFSLVLLGWGVLAFLAGTDIYHATDPNLSVEWLVFSSYFYLSLLYYPHKHGGFFHSERRKIINESIFFPFWPVCCQYSRFSVK
ncbi:MAG: hypothetical protein WC831_02610 [Parcubacteria group bacterium]|jgi:hypothetical protein